MKITEREAQFILDALTWEIQTWVHGEHFEGYVDPEVVAQAKEDFLKFTKFMGIESVVRVK